VDVARGWRLARGVMAEERAVAAKRRVVRSMLDCSKAQVRGCYQYNKAVGEALLQMSYKEQSAQEGRA
jgi:hypothetical protein